MTGIIDARPSIDYLSVERVASASCMCIALCIYACQRMRPTCGCALTHATPETPLQRGASQLLQPAAACSLHVLMDVRASEIILSSVYHRIYTSFRTRNSVFSCSTDRTLSHPDRHPQNWLVTRWTTRVLFCLGKTCGLSSLKV